MRPRCVGWLLILALVQTVLPSADGGQAGLVRVGLGSYATQPPLRAKGPPEQVWKTDAVKWPLPTNRWWSSLLWTR